MKNSLDSVFCRYYRQSEIEFAPFQTFLLSIFQGALTGCQYCRKTYGIPMIGPLVKIRRQ